jgi:hypothetical protein
MAEPAPTTRRSTRVRHPRLLPFAIALTVTLGAVVAMKYMRFHERYPLIETENGVQFPMAEQREVADAVPRADGEHVVAIIKRAEGLFTVHVARVSWLHPNVGRADVWLVDLRDGKQVAKASTVDY